MNLGNCDKCGNRLAVVRQNKYRMEGDNRVNLTEDGQPLRQDGQGRTNGKPAIEWVVACSDCGREHRQHPHQKELDEAAERTRQKEPALAAPSPLRYTEITERDIQERRFAQLEAEHANLKKMLEEARRHHEETIRSISESIQATVQSIGTIEINLGELDERLEAALAGERGRKKRVPAEA